jgi:hypothetical protein
MNAPRFTPPAYKDSGVEWLGADSAVFHHSGHRPGFNS